MIFLHDIIHQHNVFIKAKKYTHHWIAYVRPFPRIMSPFSWHSIHTPASQPACLPHAYASNPLDAICRAIIYRCTVPQCTRARPDHNLLPRTSWVLSLHQSVRAKKRGLKNTRPCNNDKWLMGKFFILQFADSVIDAYRNDPMPRSDGVRNSSTQKNHASPPAAKRAIKDEINQTQH